jgi:hypothetical protein
LFKDGEESLIISIVECILDIQECHSSILVSDFLAVDLLEQVDYGMFRRIIQSDAELHVMYEVGDLVEMDSNSFSRILEIISQRHITIYTLGSA